MSIGSRSDRPARRAKRNHAERTSIDEALSVANLNLPEIPRVEEIHVHAYTDSLGDPALRVRVVLTTDPDRRDYRWEELQPIHDEIFRVLQEAGDERFPYISFVDATELRQLANELA